MSPVLHGIMGSYLLLPTCPHPVTCPSAREPPIVHLWPPLLPATCLPGPLASTCCQSPWTAGSAIFLDFPAAEPFSKRLFILQVWPSPTISSSSPWHLPKRIWLSLWLPLFPFHPYDLCPVRSMEAIRKAKFTRPGSVWFSNSVTNLQSIKLAYFLYRFISKKAACSSLPWLVPELHPFGFLLACKTYKLHAYGLMPWISDAWLSSGSAVVWPSPLSMYLAQPASWPPPNQSYYLPPTSGWVFSYLEKWEISSIILYLQYKTLFLLLEDILDF